MIDAFYYRKYALNLAREICLSRLRQFRVKIIDGIRQREKNPTPVVGAQLKITLEPCSQDVPLVR
jgi:hypothetical protein